MAEASAKAALTVSERSLPFTDELEENKSSNSLSALSAFMPVNSNRPVSPRFCQADTNNLAHSVSMKSMKSPSPLLRFKSREEEEPTLIVDGLGKLDLHTVHHLREWINDESLISPLVLAYDKVSSENEEEISEIDTTISFMVPGTVVLKNVAFRDLNGIPPVVAGPFYLRAGPFREIFFEPTKVKACILTCGGICPGMNNVVREVAMTLNYSYGVHNIFGIKYGYRGFYDPKIPTIRLDPHKVSGIHHDGGTYLGSSRGGFDKELIMSAIIERGFNQVYVIGGDGTHKGAQSLFEETRKRGLKIVVAGIPKTIDNDIGVIDRSFGFDTAVEEATRAIQSAHIEAKCAPNGICLVRLMGRSAGFIAMYASLASRDVNACLIPEAKFRLDPLIKYIESRVKTRGHAVIVVAEGAGQELMAGTGEQDASGNTRLADIGAFLKDQIAAYFKRIDLECNVRLLDPMYLIRATPANASDSIYCSRLGQSAVHGAMAGYTGFSTGLVNSRVVYIPLKEIVSLPSRVDPSGHMWQRLITSTGQPHFI
eukprot:CAMPEP_0184338138 /NCGR_PEP_ID=MMETSP1089-20130417/6667_1 /TAXON_ID=38269 ORGANISM="Gloeochaete wittrockiana, Strain SAG46.84" /NCGR_SAMPLE_ID=MMETSP1089 /ASSEMBLY_ACC=CAM_ASM_000445 /LENGTH=539 /DNA_ID=CAMNT_0026664451 /DNA_START=21 /DNA_END=1640 /DNA_ORIENTATION=-